jgi:hypothetical protein
VRDGITAAALPRPGIPHAWMTPTVDQITASVLIVLDLMQPGDDGGAGDVQQDGVGRGAQYQPGNAPRPRLPITSSRASRAMLTRALAGSVSVSSR